MRVITHGVLDQMVYSFRSHIEYGESTGRCIAISFAYGRAPDAYRRACYHRHERLAATSAHRAGSVSVPHPSNAHCSPLHSSALRRVRPAIKSDSCDAKPGLPLTRKRLPPPHAQARRDSAESSRWEAAPSRLVAHLHGARPALQTSGASPSNTSPHPVQWRCEPVAAPSTPPRPVHNPTIWSTPPMAHPWASK